MDPGVRRDDGTLWAGGVCLMTTEAPKLQEPHNRKLSMGPGVRRDDGTLWAGGVCLMTTVRPHSPCLVNLTKKFHRTADFLRKSASYFSVPCAVASL
jgi:hypothetical protein